MSLLINGMKLLIFVASNSYDKIIIIFWGYIEKDTRSHYATCTRTGYRYGWLIKEKKHDGTK